MFMSPGKLESPVPGASSLCIFGFHSEDDVPCRHSKPRCKPEAEEKHNPMRLS